MIKITKNKIENKFKVQLKIHLCNPLKILGIHKNIILLRI
jgi:hypothetical protein